MEKKHVVDFVEKFKPQVIGCAKEMIYAEV